MENTGNLDRLCGVYRELDDEEKGRIIRLAEGLLDDQKSVFVDKTKDFDFENEN